MLEPRSLDLDLQLHLILRLHLNITATGPAGIGNGVGTLAAPLRTLPVRITMTNLLLMLKQLVASQKRQRWRLAAGVLAAGHAAEEHVHRHLVHSVLVPLELVRAAKGFSADPVTDFEVALVRLGVISVLVFAGWS
jgi:hypothetical protein